MRISDWSSDVCSSDLWSKFTQNDAQHAAQWFGRAPKQLVANGKRAKVVGSHRHLSQASDGDIECTCYGNGCQFPHGCLALVGHDTRPLRTLGQDAGYFVEPYVAFQLDGERLAVAAHGAHTHAKAVYRRGIGAKGLEIGRAQSELQSLMRS